MLRVAVVEDETEYDLQIQTTAFPDGRELV